MAGACPCGTHNIAQCWCESICDRHMAWDQRAAALAGDCGRRLLLVIKVGPHARRLARARVPPYLFVGGIGAGLAADVV